MKLKPRFWLRGPGERSESNKPGACYRDTCPKWPGTVSGWGCELVILGYPLRGRLDQTAMEAVPRVERDQVPWTEGTAGGPHPRKVWEGDQPGIPRWRLHLKAWSLPVAASSVAPPSAGGGTVAQFPGPQCDLQALEKAALRSHNVRRRDLGGGHVFPARTHRKTGEVMGRPRSV